MSYKKGEISFDIIIDPDQDRDVMEGCYKIEEDKWHVFYFTRWWQDGPYDIVNAIWESGASGINVNHPKDEILNKKVVKARLSQLLNVEGWIEVKGPDSISLK